MLEELEDVVVDVAADVDVDEEVDEDEDEDDAEDDEDEDVEVDVDVDVDVDVGVDDEVVDVVAGGTAEEGAVDGRWATCAGRSLYSGQCAGATPRRRSMESKTTDWCCSHAAPSTVFAPAPSSSKA